MKSLSAWPMGVLPLMVVGACFSVIAGLLALLTGVLEAIAWLLTGVLEAIAWLFGQARDGALVASKEMHEWAHEAIANAKSKQEKRDAP